MNDIAIRALGVSKRYELGGSRRPELDTLRDLLSPGSRSRRAARRDARHVPGGRDGASGFWALRDVSFEVRRGEAIGIIGRNGAGKSTLLKILARITEPTAGVIDLDGRVGSLLEVGTGFHPELTGRENVYLNGAILGMPRREIERRFDEIVGFAEVHEFVDVPLKHYSSGMYLRLAFAVAAHVEPDILLVDEVLAVGDAAFQKKCLGKMSGAASHGRTVLFVSHNMGAITQLCQRTLWLEGGRLERSGPSAEVVAAYLAASTAGRAVWSSAEPQADGSDVRLRSAQILSPDGRPAPFVDFDSPFLLRIVCDVFRSVRNLSVTFQLSDAQGTLVFEAMDTDLPEWKGRVREPGRYTATCRVPSLLLRPGRYHVALVSFVAPFRTVERVEAALTFDVSEVGYRFGARRRGVVSPVLDWDVSWTP